MSDTEPTEVVEEVETGYRLSISSTRGTGTRDQDSVKATGKAATLSELDEEREEMRKMVIEEMNHRRQHQPDDTILAPDEVSELDDELDALADVLPEEYHDEIAVIREQFGLTND